MKKNVIVAQSGGPSPVINASLQGVIEACAAYPDQIDRVYGGWHGIEGILLEELVDLSAQPKEEIALLRTTPAAGAIGTCRYKLKDEQTEDYERIIEVMRAHNVGYFFYIGGNDSMDTAAKVSKLAKERGLELIVTGVPKTIDNDLGDEEFTIIDHTPGYGSAARYWAYLMQNVNEENRGMCVSEPVSVLQAMGRKSGFIPAAARLADPQREMPLQLYFAESGHTLESLAENVNRQLQQSGRCIVVVSEGFDVGNLGEARDGFGHIEYGASQNTVAQVVVNYLNSVGLKARGQATGQVPGVLQRSVSIFASCVDIDEAYQVGQHAVDIAFKHGTGWMATILRKPGETYQSYFSHVPLEIVANSARHLPASWISPDRLDVTDDFIRYARPLIGDGWPDIALENGFQRFARLSVSFIEKKRPVYLPIRFR
ncbi:phosphofructokinase [Candidatus Moduliflexus flocculans]|uniref:Pyrophosphate--fructose 6-phosphate 1-phosphotransferase n=1 Tax=Candidatus Moduliflexus flocculans TaxID=1499966 RepID=A0A081BNR1_9BACT|nr:phosphofructokinase [Candidatus Moduliflexus flocculans]